MSTVYAIPRPAAVEPVPEFRTCEACSERLAEVVGPAPGALRFACLNAECARADVELLAAGAAALWTEIDALTRQDMVDNGETPPSTKGALRIELPTFFDRPR